MVTTQISRTADVSKFFPPFFSNLGPKVYSYKHLNFFRQRLLNLGFKGLSNRSSVKKFHKLHRKTPVLKSLFNKVAGPQACNFIKKRFQHRCFPLKCAKFLGTPILKNICERLVL